MLQGHDIQKLEAYYKVRRSLFFHSAIMSFSMRGWDSLVATVGLPYSLADDGMTYGPALGNRSLNNTERDDPFAFVCNPGFSTIMIFPYLQTFNSFFDAKIPSYFT
jgi:hypothetical protein